MCTHPGIYQSLCAGAYVCAVPGSAIWYVSPRIWTRPGGRDANGFHQNSVKCRGKAYRLTSMLQNTQRCSDNAWNALLITIGRLVWPCKKCLRNFSAGNTQISPTRACMGALTTSIVLEYHKSTRNAVCWMSSRFLTDCYFAVFRPAATKLDLQAYQQFLNFDAATGFKHTRTIRKDNNTYLTTYL